MSLKIKESNLSLKVKLLLFMIVIAFIPIFLLGNYSDQLTKNMIRDNIIKVQSLDLSHKIAFIEDKVQQIEKFSDWLSMNNGINELMNRSAYNQGIMDELKQKTISNLNEQFTFNGVTSNILSLFILGENGADIRGGIEAALIDPSVFYKEKWFQDYYEEQRNIYWGGMTTNYTDITTENFVIPFMRTINNQETGEHLGYMIFLLESEFFGRIYKDLDQDNQELIYIIDEKGNMISNSAPDLIEPPVDTSRVFSTVIQNIHEGKTQGSFEYNAGTSNELILYEQSKSGWMYIRCFPQVQLENQNRIIGTRLVSSVVLLLLAVIIISILVSETLTHPIERLIEQIESISKGDFKKKIDWSGNNELGQLGRSVNRMSDAIDSLLAKQAEEERQKRILEMQMLQSQINPHFLYNTLNSIKAMALLQGAYGIEKMAGNLGSLLKSAISGIKTTITIQEELEILEKYMHIQKIRYKGKVNFGKDIKDEQLLSTYILKFILQPVVENAIFHGIAPKKGIGKIMLSLEKEGQDMILSIWDNGVGIRPEYIADIEAGNNGSLCNLGEKGGIGMQNIQRRIKLVYGEDYGFKIYSQLDEFTCVVLRLPILHKDSEG